MKKTLRKFLKKYMDLVDTNKFEELYDKAFYWKYSDDYSAFIQFISDITQTLMSVGIQPQEYLSILPSGFLYCSDIKHINIPDNVTEIRSDAFCGCEQLETFDTNCVVSIHDDVFRNARGLKEITFRRSIKYLGSGILTNTDAAIRYDGTKSQWKQIGAEESAFYSCSTKTIQCKDGEVPVTDE